MSDYVSIEEIKEVIKRAEYEGFMDEADRQENIEKEIDAYLKFLSLKRKNSPTIKFWLSNEIPKKRHERREKLDFSHLSYSEKLAFLMQKEIDNEVKFIPYEKEVGRSTYNTDIPQREKLELTIKRLCYCLDIKNVKSYYSSRENTWYALEGGSYQSASNIIMELSSILAMQKLKNSSLCD